MIAMPIWHGNSAEAVELMTAVRRYCDCDQESKKVCATHAALKTDQRYLDGLVNMRQQRDKLNAEEGVKPEGERP